MFFARIVGNVWATRKTPVLENKRLLLFQKADPITGEVSGEAILAVCGIIDAGIGDMVLIADEGSAAAQHFELKPSAIRTFVFAVVDQATIGEESTQYT